MITKGQVYRKGMPLDKAINRLPLAATLRRLIVKMGREYVEPEPIPGDQSSKHDARFQRGSPA